MINDYPRLATHRLRIRYYSRNNFGMKEVDNAIIPILVGTDPQKVFDEHLKKITAAFGQSGNEAYIVTLINEESGFIELEKTIQ